MKILSTLLIATLFLFACSGEEAAKEAQFKVQDELMASGMAIHDEVMPKMGELNGYKRKINNILSSSKEQLTEQQIEQGREVVVQLDRADEAMKSWMGNIPDVEGMRSTEADHATIVKALEQSNAQATEMSALIQRALTNGAATLAALQQATIVTE